MGEKSNLSLSTDSKYESTNGTKGNVVINGNVNLAVGAEKIKMESIHKTSSITQMDL